MKILRYGGPGTERPGMLDRRGNIRDLSGLLSDIDASTVVVENIDRLRTVVAENLPLVDGSPRIAAPVTGVGKFIGIGLNYSDHAAELDLPIPSEPVLFLKATSCMVGPYDNVLLPRGSTKSDWEVELGLVMGTAASYVSEGDALKCVAGYCVINDLSERAYQFERGGQWDKGKGCDTFGPIGPYLVTSDEIEDPQNLDLWLDINGTRCQTGNTRTMIFSCARLVSYISQFMTLVPGDVIATGTPPGTGFAMKPPRYLKSGDVIQLGISGLGEQRQKVVSG